jgi:hypothetical protein
MTHYNFPINNLQIRTSNSTSTPTGLYKQGVKVKDLGWQLVYEDNERDIVLVRGPSLGVCYFTLLKT